MAAKKSGDELRELSNYSYMKTNENVQNLLNMIFKETRIHDIQCIFTYTPSMYPYVELSKESAILVWDEHFFNLFDLYIQTVMSEETYDDKVRLLQNLSLLMLSHRFDSIPSLSYAFSIMYDALNKKDEESGKTNFGYYDGSFQEVKMTDQQLEISYFSRLFVMYHEMRHCKYKRNYADNNRHALQYLAKIRHQIYQTLNPFNMPIYVGDPEHAYMIKEINYMIEKQNFRVIEEFMCDLFACIDLVELLLRTYHGNKSDEIRFAYQIASTVSMFLSDSMAFFELWENIYQNKDNGEHKKYVDNAFSFYKRDREDISIDESIVNHHFRSRLLFYCLYHRYTNDDENVFFYNLFSPKQQNLLLNGQKMIIDGFHTDLLLYIERDNRKKFTQQQCRIEKDKILHWY